MGAMQLRAKFGQVMAMVIIALAIQKDMIASLQVLTTGAGNVFRGNMALVVLAHERMSKAALGDQSIKTPRQVLKVRRGLQLWRSMRRLCI